MTIYKLHGNQIILMIRYLMCQSKIESRIEILQRLVHISSTFSLQFYKEKIR